MTAREIIDKETFIKENGRIENYTRGFLCGMDIIRGLKPYFIKKIRKEIWIICHPYFYEEMLCVFWNEKFMYVGTVFNVAVEESFQHIDGYEGRRLMAIICEKENGDEPLAALYGL